MPDTYALYRSMSAKPLGKRAFSLLFASKAPYFRTVRPQVRDVRGLPPTSVPDPV